MRLVSWNVNSLKARAEYVARYLDDTDPDVVCLQELKLEDDAVPREVFESRGYHLETHGQKQWNGVAIASKQPIEDVHCGLPNGDEGESRLIAGRVGGLHVVNLYCPQGQDEDSDKFAYKLRFYAALRDWLAERYSSTTPLAVVGDLNIAPEPDDVYDPAEFDNVPTFHPLEHVEWAKLLSLGLHDAMKPQLAPRTFSFWDYRGGAFRFDKGMRIDHVLVSTPIVPMVMNAWVDRDYRKKIDGMTPSDHAPVGVEFAGA